MKDIDYSKAAGIGRPPGRFLKVGANVLAKPVIDICNLSMSLNKFSSAFKLAKTKPIFKKERKVNALDYRPISLLPIFSKAIEKVVDKQKTKFLKDNNFSVDINLVSEIIIQHTCFYHSSMTKFLKNVDNGVYTGMILIDLQRPFDTMNHKILLDKLLPICF